MRRLRPPGYVLLRLTILLLVLPAAAASADEPFELVDGDRVVLIGGTLIERAQNYGYIETRLTARYPDRDITFRNLGWSGDTVFGDSRAGFDTAQEGFDRLVKHVLDLQPTVLLVAYGANESFAGEEGLPRFREGLNKLLDALAACNARTVLLSPTRQENLGPPLPDPAAHNRDLRLYSDELRRVAHERGHRFVDLFDLVPDGAERQPPAPLTDNGIHHTPYGYWRLASILEAALVTPRAPWRVELDAQGRAQSVSGTSLSSIEASDGSIRFTARDHCLPSPPPAEGLTEIDTDAPVLSVTGLEGGEYTLLVDGCPVVTATAEQWTAGVALTSGPSFERAERLRETIRRKNELYFHRWRPQNETYLFGFRKHEQGQNAVEIPQFDPLVAEQEALIAELRRPAEHRYELRAESEVAQ